MMTLISAIIPTFRRPLLVQRAVKSVLAQTYGRIEIVVVIDGLDDGTKAVIAELNDARIRVIETRQNRGPAAARNFGVQAAQGDYVALLDDDDEWVENKLAVQMKIVKDSRLERSDFLISCRTECRSSDSMSVICPATLYTGIGTDLSEYLFHRRTPISRPGLVASGTLLMPRSLALRLPFPTDAAHEDLSWLLLCVTRDHVPLIMADQALFIYHLQMAGTRNHTQNWQASLDWARKYRACMTGKAFSGLLSSTTAWRAKRQKGLSALGQIAMAMKREGESHFVHWLMLCGIAALPLGTVDRLRRRRN